MSNLDFPESFGGSQGYLPVKQASQNPEELSVILSTFSQLRKPSESTPMIYAISSVVYLQAIRFSRLSMSVPK